MLEKKEALYEKVVLVGVITPQQSEQKSKEYLEELAFLAQTAGGQIKKTFVQKLDATHSKTFVGKGKLEEILTFVTDNQIDTIIFDDELTPSQLKNIERVLHKKIIDRTHLILDIFAQRAQTSYARTQVELAQYQYLLPRLTHMWTHLERQKGGIGLRGPGETEIETDRRIIRDRIALLKVKLETIDRQMHTQRQNRNKMVRVALVGYTNVGKSTLMNALSKTDVLVENKLFATLDTTVRKIVVGNLPFLLTDTVGFIRKLPTQLVESFKSTLDEVREADLLLHVVDVSHPAFEDHMVAVNTILQEIHVKNKPTIVVFNKIDAYQSPDDALSFTAEDWKQTHMNHIPLPTIFISAYEKASVESLRKLLYDHVKTQHITRFPYNDFLFEYYEEDSI